MFYKVLYQLYSKERTETQFELKDVLFFYKCTF